MAEFQNFRSALNGFNREDVVHYIEYINNRHNAERNQLKTELQTAQAQLEEARSIPSMEEDLTAQLMDAEARCAALEAELADVRAQLEQALLPKPQTDEELEAYRRAERVERTANARVAQLYAQANGALAEATVKVDEAATQVGTMADQITAQLGQLHAAVAAGKNTLRTAAAALYAVRPIEDKD